ncbi:MAG: MotA/TolQ/ExbB proton channel family protein [Thiogranum sp.]
MQPVRDHLELMRDFFESGGYVLGVIFVVSLLLWALIVERYVYLRLVYPKDLGRLVDSWRLRSDQSSWFAHKIRLALIYDMATRLTRSQALIKSLIAICPLLGLLGTVTGMIHVFDAMAVLGTGNARAMSAGISMATIPTMAGLVVALSGLFFSARLRQLATLERQRVADLLREYEGESP